MKDKIVRIGIFLVCLLFIYQFAVKPLIKKDGDIKEASSDLGWAKNDIIKEKDKYDVIVYGEEPEGLAASLAAARSGAKTLLVASGSDLGGLPCSSLDFNFEILKGVNNEALGGKIFKEIASQLGTTISSQKYKSVMKSLVEEEKDLQVVYGGVLVSATIDNESLYGINLVVDKKETSYYAKRFIDASKNGDLLFKCNVPFTKGADDLNLKNIYRPVGINFEVANVKWTDVEELLGQNKIARLKDVLSQYQPIHPEFKLGKVGFFDEGDQKVIVQGIEAFDIDVSDHKAVEKAYVKAVEETKNFAGFLKDRLIPFQNSVYESTADKFIINDYRHFKGEHVLSINEALENTDFIDKIAVVSNSIVAYSQGDSKEKYVIGKPALFSIPLGCTIPKDIDNLYMVGDKISYSSLVSSGTTGYSTSMTVGESAGVAAVYSIVKNQRPREFLNKGSKVENMNELNKLLIKLGAYLPNFKIKNPNVDSWVYPSIRQLNTLGIISSGNNNDYKLDKEATQKEFAALLLNGVARLAPEKYSLELDERLRPYFTDKGLTLDKAAEILLAMNGQSSHTLEAYIKACTKGLINDAMALRLRDKKILTLNHVYELSAYNISLYTGKDFPQK
ncbi:MAG TPA: FAD-dependent oxidoreductase [Pseudobacteroides sp.]|uniref:FAD-dependent oxidoreductase n=1 Tax=Pseudobacteroides sp. TaxID=1968840 RepID=UPI002F95E45F